MIIIECKESQPFEAGAQLNNIKEFSPYGKENNTSPLQMSTSLCSSREKSLFTPTILRNINKKENLLVAEVGETYS
jgi:hypothetical protein